MAWTRCTSGCPSKFSDYERALIGALLSSSAEPAVTETSIASTAKSRHDPCIGQVIVAMLCAKARANPP